MYCKCDKFLPVKSYKKEDLPKIKRENESNKIKKLNNINSVKMETF